MSATGWTSDELDRVGAAEELHSNRGHSWVRSAARARAA
jgi:hypothetical protein